MNPVAPVSATFIVTRPPVFARLPSLVGVGKADQVDAGKRGTNLLHPSARDKIAEVDNKEAGVLEQLRHLGLRVDVVAREKDRTLAGSLVRIGAEHRGGEGVRAL